MTSELFTNFLNEIHHVHELFHTVVDMGFLMFCRMLGFVIMAPVFGRKDIPFNIKLGFALLLTWVLVWVHPIEAVQNKQIDGNNVMTYALQIIMNVTVGYFIGFIAGTILEVINSAGSIMNNQIGLSSAMMFDPSTRQQVALTERLFNFIALMVFFQVGGMYWVISALERSFEVFPLHLVGQDIAGEVSFDYLVQITGNCIAIGTQLVAPVIVVTLGVDLILGIVNRTAQQIQVFQLSFALKPCIGLAAFLVSLPIFMRMVEYYLHDYAHIF